MSEREICIKYYLEPSNLDVFTNVSSDVQTRIIQKYNDNLIPFNRYREYQQLVRQQLSAGQNELNEIRNRLITTQTEFRLNDDEVSAIIEREIEHKIPPPPPPTPLLKKIIQKAREIYQRIYGDKYIKYVLLALTVTVIVVLAWVVGHDIQPPIPTEPSSSPVSSVSPVSDAELEKRISSGEKNLVTIKYDYRDKVFFEGVDDFRYRRFKKAEGSFEKAIAHYPNDPEALIYKNNAIAMQHDHVSIVTSVPISGSSGSANNALGILRGIAMVQNDINQGKNKDLINGKYLLVTIANDGNDVNTASQLVDLFANDGSSLAVIGHNKSSVSQEVASQYSSKKLVMLSPTSTVTNLRKYVKTEGNNYVYRVVPTDGNLAERLRQYTERQGFALQKIYPCIEDAPNTEDFLKKFFGDPQKTALCKLNNLNQAEQDLKKALEEDGFSALLLLPASKDISDKALSLSAELFKNYPREKLGLFGNDVMFTDPNIPDPLKEIINKKLTVVAPWHPQANKSFTNKYNELFGFSTEIGSDGLNWRTAMAYDAALALTEALKKVNLTSNISENRQAVAKALQSVNIEGATKTIQFTPDGDRNVSVAPKGYIVQFDKNAKNQKIYRSDFVCIEGEVEGQGCDSSTVPKTDQQ